MVGLCTLEQVTVGKKPYIILFSRQGLTRTKTVIDNFQPYFYIPETEYPYLTHKPIEKYPALLGESTSKFYVQTPEDVKELRRQFSKTWEGDVRYHLRYLIDEVPKIDKVNLRSHYTDIETNEKEEIVSIAVFDSYLNKVVCFAWREDLKPEKLETAYTFPSGYQFKASIYLYSNKIEMLQNYVKFVRSTEPDVLTGWYFIDFDMKEIIRELNSTQGLSSSWLSPIGKCYVSRKDFGHDKEDVVCKGRVVWDMLIAYKTLQPTGLPDSSLEAISQKELGEGKKPLEHHVFWYWHNDFNTMIEYCCKDAVLVHRIDKKCHVLDYYDTMRRWTGCGWDNLFSDTQMWDIYLLRKVHGKQVLPTKVSKIIPKIKGAEVFETTKGIHKWICLLDLKSLYPSIIITFNLSPETLFNKNEHINTPVNNCYNLSNGISFKKQPMGLLPSVLLEMKQERAKYQAEMAKYPFGTVEYNVYFNLQTAIKVFMNALYGSMLYKNFRISSREIGESVTYCGREIIKWIRKRLEELGFKILAGDTDSVFYFSQKDNLPEIIKELENVVAILNADLPKKIEELGNAQDNCQIKIEAKKIYEHLLLAKKKSKKTEGGAKKRYAGRVRFAEGKEVDQLDVMGFEVRRSNNSRLTVELQKKVFRCLLGFESRENLKVYIQEARKILSNPNPDYEYVGIPQGIGTDLESYKTSNPWIKGVLFANEFLGLKFGIGDKPKLIYVSGLPKEYPKTETLCFRNNLDITGKGFILDTNKMFEKTVVMKLESLFDAADINLEEILFGQKSLNQF